MWYGDAATSGDCPWAMAHRTTKKPPTTQTPKPSAIQAARRGPLATTLAELGSACMPRILPPPAGPA